MCTLHEAIQTPRCTRDRSITHTADALCDRGSTFPTFFLWVIEPLKSKSSERQSCFEKWCFCILGPWSYSSGCDSIFVEVNFRVRYGAPSVRSLRKLGWTFVVERLRVQIWVSTKSSTRYLTGVVFYSCRLDSVDSSKQTLWEEAISPESVNKSRYCSDSTPIVGYNFASNFLRGDQSIIQSIGACCTRNNLENTRIARRWQSAVSPFIVTGDHSK